MKESRFRRALYRVLFYIPPPEHSVPFRLATLATVMTGIVAVLAQQEWPSITPWVIGSTLIGFWWSWLRREKSNWWVKIILSVLMWAALANFMWSLYGNPYDPRIPLANLLLWLQAIHSFDLPARRDLNYSVLVGLILVAMSAALSFEMSYVAYLAAFLVCSQFALLYNCSSILRGRTGEKADVPFRVLLRMVLQDTLVLLVVTAVIFVFIPRKEGLSIRPLPMSWILKLPHLSTGKLVNPGYPEGGAGSAAGRNRIFNPDSYFGFSSFLDLNMRGELSDQVVMKVKSSEWAYYRGLAFDRYTGQGWEFSQEKLTEISAPVPPFFTHSRFAGDHEIVQIFYIQVEQPNIVYGAFLPDQVFFPSETLWVDEEGGIRSPYPLERDMVYSCVSKSRQPDPRMLRKLRGVERHPRQMKAMAPYLALPEVPDRVRKLAHDLTDQYPSPIEKAMAVSLYLQKTYPYRTDVPPTPGKDDAVDWFLFREKAGYCEHFASAMAVLLRCAGVPARLVTGYAPGSYNPITGFYEVRQKDAHAWVEVFLADFGWATFDPTPGAVGLVSEDTHKTPIWILAALVRYLEGALPVSDVGRWWAGTAPAALRAAKVCGVLLVVLLIYEVTGRLLRRKGVIKGSLLRALLSRKAAAPPGGLTGARLDVALVYGRMCREMARRGRPRGATETPAEYSASLKEIYPWPEIDRLTEAFHLARYSTRPTAEPDVRASEEILAKIRENLRHEGKGPGGS